MIYDKDIREPLFEFLEETRGKIRIIEEKQIGKSRADIVMVEEDKLVGLEIKSDADTYVRLAGQVKDYDLYFDCNYIVAGSKHALHIKEYVPEYWGIITVEEMEQGLDFFLLREPKDNPKVKLKKKLGLLWRIELNHIIEINQLPKYKQKSKAFVVDKILEKVPEELIHKQISEELFQRDYTTINEVIETYRKEVLGKTRKRRRKKRIKS